MKKNVKRIERTVVDEKITWIASDGTVFENEGNCREYEDTCKCKVMSLLANVEKKEMCPVEDFPIPYASEDCHVDVYNIKSNADVDALIMYLAYMKEIRKLWDDGDSFYPSYEEIGELYYIYFNYDDEIIEFNTVNSFIKRINKKYTDVINQFKTITEEKKGDTKDGD